MHSLGVANYSNSLRIVVKKLPLILICFFLVSSPVKSQPHIVLDSVGGQLVCPNQFTGSPLNVYISICNSDSIQSAFRIVLNLESRYGGNVFLPSVIFLNGFETFFPANQLTVNFEGTATARKLIIQGNNGSIPISNDTIQYFRLWFHPVFSKLIDSLCIDSSSSATFGDWEFSNPSQPTWTGSSCALIWVLDNSAAIITNCPNSQVLRLGCNQIQYDFNGASPTPGPVGYLKTNGVGTVDRNTGLWTYQTSPSEVGETLFVEIAAYRNICFDHSNIAGLGPSCRLSFIVGASGANYPSYLPTQPYKYIAVSGETLSVQLQVLDPDPVNNHRFNWYTSWQDPTPNASIDSLTGVFKYYGETADTNRYWIYNSVNECGIGDTMGFYIYHYENFICGDLNHDGTAANVLDLTWIVDYFFRGGPSPAPKEAGNMNCAVGVNILDLTYLVDRLFRSGLPPCSACPKL